MIQNRTGFFNLQTKIVYNLLSLALNFHDVLLRHYDIHVHVAPLDCCSSFS